MAQITTTLTITGPASTATPAGPLSIALSLTATDTPTTDGKVTCDIVTATTTHSDNKILDNSTQTSPAYVYIKNTSDTVIYLCTADAATPANQVMEIGAGEFAFFPWAAEVDYYLESASGSKTAEVWVFAQGA